jgi:hypothetical protein
MPQNYDMNSHSFSFYYYAVEYMCNVKSKYNNMIIFFN